MSHILFWLLNHTTAKEVTRVVTSPVMGGSASAIIAPHTPTVGLAVGIAVSVTIALSLCSCCCCGTLIGWEHIKLSKLKKNLNNRLQRGQDTNTLPLYNVHPQTSRHHI